MPSRASATPALLALLGLVVVITVIDVVLKSSAGIVLVEAAAVAVVALFVLRLAAARDQLAEAAAGRDRELSRERAARRRADVLARVGQLLEAPLDPATVMAELTALTVGELADLAIVDLLDEHAELHGVVTAAADVQVAADIRTMRERAPLDIASDHPICVVARTGEPLLMDDITDDILRRHSVSALHLEAMRAAGYRSAVIVPLRARGRAIGALTLLRLGETATPYDEADLQLGLELAVRAALALDNARLFAELRTTERRLEAIVTNLDEAVSALGPDGRYLFANEAAARIAGHGSVAELLAGDHAVRAAGLLVLDEHGVPVDPADEPVARALRGERPDPTLTRVVSPSTGEERWVVSRAAPVFDEAERLTMVVAVTEDVTALKHQESHQRLLSEASKLMSSSLDTAATVDKAAWAAVPEFCDWARVDLVDERGELREVATAHRDLERLELLREWRREYPPDPAGEDGPAQVLRTGEPVHWAEVHPGDIERHARDERHAGFMRTIDTRSMVIVPMIAGDRTIGTMELATTGESGRHLGADEIEIASELARRAAIAVENARIHEARTTIATALQRSLLPPRLPVVPGLTIAARFRAAGDTSEVGGDFYDLFPAAGGWMVVVGDVTGKGPEAAAITSLVRYTIRTAAQYEPSPERLLARLNVTLGDDPEIRRLCTAVCALVEPGDEGVAFTVACAGHPAPLLVDATGGVRHVGPAGTLLGAFDQGSWTQERVVLGDDEALVLFTDGVTDARGVHGPFGIEGLEAVLAGGSTVDADALAGRVDAALQEFEHGPQRDDIALLVLRAAKRPEFATTSLQGS